MAIDKITLEIPGLIVSQVQAFQAATVGADRVVPAEDYQDQDKIEDGVVKVQVYPLTRRTSGHSKGGIKTVEATYYLAVSRKCKPSDKTKLRESIQYAIDLAELFDGIGSNLATGDVPAFSYVPTEDDAFLWFPNILNTKNKFVALVELRYTWRTSTEITTA